MPEKPSFGKAIQQTGSSFSLRDSFSGEGNLVATLFHFRRKRVMSVGCFLSPG